MVNDMNGKHLVPVFSNSLKGVKESIVHPLCCIKVREMFIKKDGIMLVGDPTSQSEINMIEFTDYTTTNCCLLLKEGADILFRFVMSEFSCVSEDKFFMRGVFLEGDMKSDYESYIMSSDCSMRTI